MNDKPYTAPLDRSRELPAAQAAPDHNGGLARLELRQLRYFVTLAEEWCFGRAATREHIVQSALSQQVQRLERAPRVALVERARRGTLGSSRPAASLLSRRVRSWPTRSTARWLAPISGTTASRAE